MGAELEDVLLTFERHRDRLEPAQRAGVGVTMTNTLGTALRFRDPERAERVFREQLALTPPNGVILVRLARMLSDFDRTREAEDLLRPTVPPIEYPFATWERCADVEVGRAALARGDVERARALVLRAFEGDIEQGMFPLYSAAILADIGRAANDPVAVIDTVNRALAVSDELGSPVGEELRWRRGRALLELARLEEARVDLDAARQVLEAKPVGRPIELLGCLSAYALLVHRDNPQQAAEVLAVIAQRRGSWILPHLADRDVATVAGRLAP